MKKALITGITGQDGSFLSEFLIDKGYEVHGILRRSSSFNTGRIEHLYLDEWVRDMKKKRLVNLHWGDMTDSSSLIRIIAEIRPDEIYNLAAQSHVKVSFDVPEFTAEADAIGVLRLLEAVRIVGLADTCRIYQASTSELYGLVQEVPQKETTPFYPRSPYGVAKLYGFWIMKNYRESYNMYCCNGILFNHESERRGETFVTRKITLAAARIAQGFQDKLYLGNLNSLRDWGYARDYVECMWLILQQEQPDDFVIATGQYHTVREFCTLAFKEVGINLRWEGEGVNEKGIDIATGKVLVEVDPKYFRPAEVDQLLGDPSKAKQLPAITSKTNSQFSILNYQLSIINSNPCPRFSSADATTCCTAVTLSSSDKRRNMATSMSASAPTRPSCITRTIRHFIPRKSVSSW